MKSITINGSKRESVGKSSSKALRNAGQIPCVLYGGDGPIHFSAPELAFSKLVYTANAYTVVIALSDNESYSAVLQDIQFHPVSDKILHIDFYQLFDDKKIAMDIPVRLVGNAIGVKLGGNLQRNKRKLRIKALPTNLPDNIEIDSRHETRKCGLEETSLVWFRCGINYELLGCLRGGKELSLIHI